MPAQPTEDERVIGAVLTQVTPLGGRLYVGGSTVDNVPSAVAEWFIPPQSPVNKRMGGAYGGAGQRHPDEYVLDELLRMAKAHFPNETIDLRNATVGTHPLVDRYGETIYSKYYIADVITTEPMPAPITHSRVFSLIGASQADLFQQVNYWLNELISKNTLQVEIQSVASDGSGIRGEYIFEVLYGGGNVYEITSSFSIDIYDENVRITLAEPRLQRKCSAKTSKIYERRWGANVSDTVQAKAQRAELEKRVRQLEDRRKKLNEQEGVALDLNTPNPQAITWAKEAVFLQKRCTGIEEPIFLQSIANLVNAEFVNFSEHLKQSIGSQNKY
jgi:hypothetical protein